MAKITALSFVMPVRDLEKSVKFYCDVFGLTEVFRSEQIVFVGLPGTDSALGILLDPERAGGGPQHMGFHVDHAVEHESAIKDVEAAGGSVIERGEHGPGIPFARIADPDGNTFEI
jgi:catechol 2,3-dioxygenase-like lactoylglutathione lyase family enzyme